MDRYAHARRVAALDAEADCHEVYRTLVAHEFSWDMNQSLSFALFGTFAGPSIGALLAHTGEFEQRTQKRYEDTALLLDAVLEHGPRSPGGVAALRRINAMHRAYGISDDHMRFVLTGFVVSPDRWIEAYRWRRLTEHERTATARYWYEVGRLMGIGGLPRTWREMTALHDAYEAERFASAPPPGLGPLVRAALRLRGRVVRLLPPREQPLHARSFPSVRGYPDGHDVAGLGTFPNGCPVQRPAAPAPV